MLIYASGSMGHSKKILFLHIVEKLKLDILFLFLLWKITINISCQKSCVESYHISLCKHVKKIWREKFSTKFKKIFLIPQDSKYPFAVYPWQSATITIVQTTNVYTICLSIMRNTRKSVWRPTIYTNELVVAINYLVPTVCTQRITKPIFKTSIRYC